MRKIITCGAATVSVLLCSCSATSALINHSSLDVSSKMSNTIFLDPTTSNKQTIYIQVKNTTDQDMSGLTSEIKNDFTKNGWQIVTDPTKAYNMVQVNVLQAGEAQDPDAVWRAVQSGFGATAFGGLAGLAAAYGGMSSMGSIGVGAGVGAASWIADQAVKNVAYSVITDVQVSVKTTGKVSTTQTAALKQGRSTVENQSFSSSANWLKYQTRIGTVAQKVNLKFPDAKPKINKQLGKQIAGIFVSNE